MVNSLLKKHKTYDPFKIASRMNIILLYEDLGKINGYYNRCYRQRFIHINQSLSSIDQYYVCCHELAHVVLHKDVNISFFQTFTNLNTGRIEREADDFAIELMSKNPNLVITESNLLAEALHRSRWGLT